MLLHENERILNNIFAFAPVGMAFMRDRICRKINQSFLNITGYSEEESLTQNSRILYVSDEEFQTTGQRFYSQIREKGYSKGEVRFKRKNGDIVDVLLYMSSIDPINQNLGVIVIAIDITEQKLKRNN